MKLRQFLNNTYAARTIALLGVENSKIYLRGHLVFTDGSYAWCKECRKIASCAMLMNLLTDWSDDLQCLNTSNKDDAIESVIRQYGGYEVDYLWLDEDLMTDLSEGWHFVVFTDILPCVFTHNIAADIIGSFEDLLTDAEITIPCDDEGEQADRIASNGEDDTGLYGTPYSNLLDDIEAILVEYLEERITAPTKELIADMMTIFNAILVNHDVYLGGKSCDMYDIHGSDSHFFADAGNIMECRIHNHIDDARQDIINTGAKIITYEFE